MNHSCIRKRWWDGMMTAHESSRCQSIGSALEKGIDSFRGAAKSTSHPGLPLVRSVLKIPSAKH